MSYSLTNPNPGPSCTPRENFDTEVACYFCRKGTPIKDTYRVECSDCDGACPDAVVYACWPCSNRATFRCGLCVEIEGTAVEE